LGRPAGPTRLTSKKEVLAWRAAGGPTASCAMCIIAVALKRKLTLEEAENCFLSNPDGAGVAWSRGDRNYLRKGFMGLDEFIEFYEELDALPHVVHCRAATSGGVRPELTHPFIVDLQSPPRLEWSGKKPLLFHNGVVSKWEDLFLRFAPDIVRELRRSRKGSQIPPGPWSDTRTVAVIAALVGEGILPFLGGKYAVLDRGRVRTYGEFVEENGVLFSNTSYKGIRARHTKKYPYSWVPKGGVASSVAAARFDPYEDDWWSRGLWKEERR